MKSWILRDIKARKAVYSHELERTIWRYMARNTTLPPRTRMQAQLALSRMPREAASTATKNRCIETGRGRGVISDWKLCRFQFRLKALNGELPGVQKASCSDMGLKMVVGA
ncbi:40S ribosomal protein mrp2, mitochondrial [Spiromyces aspiralis]|uniref:40S ribosomal protein mrp2, mitochondrial n=1 Tax=Spiromyces aspiralis TaxID=68401 RepID=A0ACC1HPZ0_9FUNG|nr:40S ribosomal protein mrp2, mitochondrial [Spiromyces aspiralis]